MSRFFFSGSAAFFFASVALPLTGLENFRGRLGQGADDVDARFFPDVAAVLGVGLTGDAVTRLKPQTPHEIGGSNPVGHAVDGEAFAFGDRFHGCHGSMGTADFTPCAMAFVSHQSGGDVADADLHWSLNRRSPPARP